MKTQTSTFVIITALLIAFRCILNDSEQLVFANALLNVVAILLVFISITEQIIKNTYSRIDDMGVPKEIKLREKRRTKIYTRIFSYFFYTIICAVYLVFLVSELGNDIVSITSLGLSLIDKSIAISIANSIKL